MLEQHALPGQAVERGRLHHRVAIGADVPCGECAFCEAGIGNNCQINYAMGYQFPGSFAEYVLLNRTVVNHGPVHRLPDHVSYDEAALAEPLGCVLNALELSPVRFGDAVVVKRQPGHDLLVEGPLPEPALSALSDQGKDLHQDPGCIA